jgi:DNA-binding IclR family transcriptional regulator
MTGLSQRRTAGRPKVVKSAERTLRLLEFFDEVRHPVNVVEVMRRLKYPQSSTSALLRSLVAMGYLAHDPRSRTYAPTDRVSLLGNWISPRMFGDASLPHMIQAIANRVGHVVLLAARNGDYVQYIHVKTSNAELEDLFRLGMRRPLHNTATGLALLAGLRDQEVRGIYHRLNAYAEEPDEVIQVPELLKQLNGIRGQGHAFTFDHDPTNTAFVAMHMPRGCSTQPLVIGAGGPCDEILERKEEILEVVREEIAAHFGDSLSRGHRSIVPQYEPLSPVRAA